MTNLTENKILTDTSKVIHENGKHKSVSISPENVQTELKKHMLVDGFDITIDLEKSGGAYLYDSKHGKNYLDFFTYVASNPLGMNHPKLNNEKFINEIGKVAVNKPSLSDIYTETQAEFVSTFFKYAVPEYFKFSFFIEGGALAVENALKAAIDWKVRKNFKKGYTEEKGHQIIHFREAFHGRSGYTMSLTNTDPTKILYYPKFKWPRIDNPKITFPLNEENLANVIAAEDKAVSQIKTALAENKDDIAAIILEPIQGEGGDNHFRKEFFIKLRELCDENEMMLIFDEVQTGIALTGKMWAHMHYVQPDLISFGKKTQVCGVLCTGRIDEIEENVFRMPSRINSTWGGNMTDMKRFTKILEIISEENLVENCKVMGEHLQNGITGLAEKYSGKISNGRGLGLFCAFDAANGKMRDEIRSRAFDNELILLGSGEKSVRFRPPVNIRKEDIDKGLAILDKVINGI
ncbi:MAG TPA: L-lysine 6-transaminase [Ignavibacteria bacterium]|nr:L-lysine 6-transaminase [Bacteroidota bacterium]HRI84935.1 L-lysine 6-transaminase [Ignavibacteria bacterium]HRK00120.1 L-lysine 6-transaminase [Ignavibacteria bacterium]